MTIAAIDIGTNTLLMTIARKEHHEVLTILHDIHNIARLGEGVDERRIIQPQALERAIVILKAYRNLCDKEHVEQIVAVATSAVRDAANRDAILQAMSVVLGAEIQCISGEEEARYSFLGGAETDERITVMDIGGGSTEFITGEDGAINFHKSLDMGAVRITERFFSTLPPKPFEIEAAKEYIRSLLNRVPSDKLAHIIGVGGTFTSIAAIHYSLSEFKPETIHRQSLPAETVHAITTKLLSMSAEELRSHPNIHPKRADILPAGALILSETLYQYGHSQCMVSTKGLRYGLLYDTTQTLRSL